MEFEVDLRLLKHVAHHRFYFWLHVQVGCIAVGKAAPQLVAEWVGGEVDPGEVNGYPLASRRFGNQIQDYLRRVPVPKRVGSEDLK